MNSQKHSEVTFGEFLTLLKPYKIAISTDFRKPIRG